MANPPPELPFPNPEPSTHGDASLGGSASPGSPVGSEGPAPSGAPARSSSQPHGFSGFFLVLEGVEGAGKTTQARLLAAWLAETGVAHRVAREPGGTPVGEAIRSVLLERRDVDVGAATELLLMLAARAAYVRQVVRPELAGGRLMVSDRFELSTFAYQGVGRGLGLAEVRRLNTFATGGLRPDLTLVFDLPVEEGRARQEREGKVQDRIEGEGDRFLKRVAGAYRRFADEDPDVVLIDASPSVEEVHGRVRNVLEARLPEPFRPRRG